MPTAYKNARGQRAVRQWCSQALARADFPLTSATVDTSVGRVRLTSAGAGAGRPRVVMVPGTGSNAAVALPWLRALSARWPTTVVDLPGQPGLSDPRRPRRARLAWYGRALDEILAAMDADGVVLVGNSLGAAVALAAGSPRIAARALISPAGFIRLSVDPEAGAGFGRLAAASHHRAHPPHAPVVRRPRRGPARDRGGVDGPHGHLLPHDSGPSAAARRTPRPSRRAAVCGRGRRT